jgi:hypothetical protein
MSGQQPPADPRLAAAVALIGRTGADSFQLRFNDDEAPVVWIAVAEYSSLGHHETDASLDPVRAVLRLAERLVDGGQCMHCRRPSGLDPDSVETMPLDTLVCWYQYDPELRTFRRGCEGDQ